MQVVQSCLIMAKQLKPAVLSMQFSLIHRLQLRRLSLRLLYLRGPTGRARLGAREAPIVTKKSLHLRTFCLFNDALGRRWNRPRGL